MKQGIIVVNHGTVDQDVRTRSIDDFVLSIGDRLEEADIVAVYTDGDIRKQLRENVGEKVQNLKAAILSMKERGVTDLVVVSTDVHDCDEYKQMKEETVGLAGLFRTVGISQPLLYSETDMNVSARAVKSAFGERVGEDMLILVMSGDKTDGVEELKLFEKSLQEHIPNSHVATLHGENKLYRIIKKLKADGIESGRVVLVPFEFMAGENVENEVSREYTVLAERLESEGYTVEQLFKGLAEYDEFQRLYMRHLYDAAR